VEYKHILFTIT